MDITSLFPVYLTASLIAPSFASAPLFAKNTLSSINIEVERITRQVKDQKKTNQSLSMKINELASLENIENIHFFAWRFFRI